MLDKDYFKIAMITTICLGVAGFGLLAVSVAAEHSATDEQTVRELNQKYIEAFLHSDVEWYQAMLTEDFVCIDSDGSILHKAEFLEQAGEGPDVLSYDLDEVNVRFYGSVALVQATGRFTRKNGTVGQSRYTDIYVHKKEGWKVVSAQITRGA